MTKVREIAKSIKDPVSEMKIFKESVNKEKINQKLYQNFQINQPTHVQFYSEKPNNNSFLLMKLKNQGRTINGVDIDEKLNNQMNKTELEVQINQRLKTVKQTPKDKYVIPQTSNQEIGWFYDKAKDVDGRFIHRRESCSQTHYADNYYTMKHTSLFSNHKQK